MNFSESNIETLRRRVKSRLSTKRYEHTLGVERCVIDMGKACLPLRINELRCAALLHDIAKEFTTDEQLAFIEANKFSLNTSDRSSYSVLHSFAAPWIIKRDFADFVTKDILSATEKHTVGGEDFSLFDEIVFLADYIEDGRKYDDCIEVRKFFFDNITEDLLEKNITVLHEATLRCIENTIRHLESHRKDINPRTIATGLELKKKLNLVKENYEK